MLGPRVFARVIKPDKTASPPGEGTDIRSLGNIAAQTRESKIAGAGRPAMFPADDVIHMKAEVGVGLVNEAVFTESARPPGHKTAQSG